MTPLHFHVYFKSGNLSKTDSCSAELEVPGIGKVNITNCLSEETIRQIEHEIEQACREKFKKRIT